MSAADRRALLSGASAEVRWALILSAALTAWGVVFLRSVPALLFDRSVALVCLGLLLLPFLLFSAREFVSWLGERTAESRILLPLYMTLVHLLYGVGPGRLSLRSSLTILAYAGLPVLFATLARRIGALPNLLDGITVLLLYFPIELSLLAPAWQPVNPGVPSPSHPFGQLIGMSLLLYCFLVLRALPQVGFTFRLGVLDLGIALLGFALFFPVALVLGGATGFVSIRPHLPDPSQVVGVVLGTSFLVALPEEILFRGVVQNLLERLARTDRGRKFALLVASFVFGLTHLNNMPLNDWRYVMLATIAGVVYGTVYRLTRKVTAAAVTHALIDVVWRLFF